MQDRCRTCNADDLQTANPARCHKTFINGIKFIKYSKMQQKICREKGTSMENITTEDIKRVSSSAP